MANIDFRPIVHFRNGYPPRAFASRFEAISFVTTYCPAEADDTAWIGTNGERTNPRAVRSLAEG